VIPFEKSHLNPFATILISYSVWLIPLYMIFFVSILSWQR